MLIVVFNENNKLATRPVVLLSQTSEVRLARVSYLSISTSLSPTFPVDVHLKIFKSDGSTVLLSYCLQLFQWHKRLSEAHVNGLHTSESPTTIWWSGKIKSKCVVFQFFLPHILLSRLKLIHCTLDWNLKRFGNVEILSLYVLLFHLFRSHTRLL